MLDIFKSSYLSLKYQIEITNRFAALENLNVDENVIGLGKTLKRISKPQLKRA